MSALEHNPPCRAHRPLPRPGDRHRRVFRTWACLLAWAIVGLWASRVQASSTTGTPRGLLIDGVVSLGTGGVDWAADEVFQGFSGAVNWYLTWDDDSLYIGRIGGNNAEGSVIYLHADYAGAVTTNRGQLYDGLEPEASRMGGVNFAAYLKDTYDEYRTWNGAWSGANTSLLPRFTAQANGANLEVAIPWNAITNGNGKPTNIRAVMYQVVPAPNFCSATDAFVYGESPWGTGLPGDGPNLGVNDGIPVSSRQPGGCSVGRDTLTRWWGCYPVIGGVGSNGWLAVAPDAGPDDSICASATSYQLQGNVPPATAAGTWSLVSQPAGSSPVSIQFVDSASTAVSNLDGIGVYTFVWGINYGGCPSVPDTVRITREPLPPLASAMPDLDLPCDQDSALLSANGPGFGSGLWALLSGGGTFANASSPNTTITGLAYGSTLLRWTISSGNSCPGSSDSLLLFRFAPPVAAAGPAQTLCGSSTSAAANDPTLLQATASGLWSQVIGPSTVAFGDSSAFNTTISNLQLGSYALLWTVANGTCPSATDTLFITVVPGPVANAGPDDTLCANASSYILQATPPPGGSTGTWAVVSQPAGSSPVNFVTPTSPNSLIQNLDGIGSYLLTWTLNNGICNSSPDTVLILREPLPPLATTAPDSILPCGQNSGVLIGSNPFPGTGVWSLVSGQASISAPGDSITGISNLGFGENIFSWTVSAGGSCPTTSAQVSVFYYVPVFADAGADQGLCAVSIVTTSALDPTLQQASAFGHWTQLSGPSTGLYANDSAFNTNISNLQPGSYSFVWEAGNGNCPVDRDTVAIVIYAAPSADAGPDESICTSLPYLLDGNDPSVFGPFASGVWRQLNGPSTVIFSDSNQYNSSVSNLSAGVYKFLWTVTNGNCPASLNTVSLLVTQIQDGGVQQVISPTSGQADGSITVNPPINGVPPFQYSLGSGPFQTDPLFAGLSAGSYTINLLDGNGCTDSLLVILSDSIPPGPDPDSTLTIPDGFSPNADGVNDTWEILGIGYYPQAEVELYNIWGGLIYSSQGAYTPWNGQFNGQDMPQATYYYIVDLRKDNGAVHKGSVTLFR